MTSKKCTKKRDAHAELLFCQSKHLLFCRSRWSSCRRCLSSLLVKQWLPAQGPVKVKFQQVTWPQNSDIQSVRQMKWWQIHEFGLKLWQLQGKSQIQWWNTNRDMAYSSIGMRNDHFWNSYEGHTYPTKRAFSLGAEVNNLWGLYMHSKSHYSC